MSSKCSDKKYFVKEDNGIFVVKSTYFDAIKSRTEAIAMALRTLFELRRQLQEDALDNSNSFIGAMKVTTGLDRTLSELDCRFPLLLSEIKSVERRTNGTRVSFNC